MNSLNLLCLLASLAAICGAFMHGHFVSTRSGDLGDTSVNIDNQLATLRQEIEDLREENQTLRELATNQSDFIVPKDWIAFIEESNGFQFKKSPQVIRAQEDEFLKVAATAWTENFTERGMIDRAYAFKTLGLIPPSNLTIQLALAESGPGTRRALYDHERGCLIVAQNFDPKHIFDRAALTQALSVALLEQNFPLEKGLSDDAWLARRMVIHGHSIIIQQLDLNRSQKEFELNGAQVKSPISPEALKNSADEFNSLPRFVRLMIRAHSIWGRPFVEAQSRESKAESLTKALQNASSSARVILGKEAAPTQLKPANGAFLTTSLGAFGVLSHALLGETIKDPEAIAGQWVSDQLEFLENEEKSIVLTWSITFSSTEAAETFSTHVKDVIPNAVTSVDAGKLTIKHIEKVLNP